MKVPWFFLGLLLALAAGWGLFPALLYRSDPQPLHFSHRTHTGDELGMACADCHGIDDAGQFTGIPATERCAECHAAVIGETEAEQTLVADYVETGRQIPWRVYARQPDNVWFPHAAHVARGSLECAACHGDHGSSDRLRPAEFNRISGYSRDIWGASIGGALWARDRGMKMDRCIGCHADHGRSDGCIGCHR